MPLTPEQEARYQELAAQYDRPSFLDRFGAASYNAITDIPNSITAGTIGMANMAGIPIPKEPFVQPAPFALPVPQTAGEVATEVLPHIASSVATIAIPQVAATKGLAVLGAAPRVAGIGGAFFGGAVFGAETSPEEAGAQGSLNALQQATEYLPRKARVPLSLGIGVGAGMEAYSQGASPAAAIGTGVANTLIPFLPRHQALDGPMRPPAIIPDEIIPPEKRWRQARPIRSDTMIEEVAPLQLDHGMPMTAEGIPVPQLRDAGPIVPVHNRFDDNLPADRQLYNVQLAEHAEVVPFTMKDGVIVPTWQERMLLPEHVAARNEPTAAEAAIATLQPKPDKPSILDIEPTINIKGKPYRGAGEDTHQHILDRYMNENVDDADAIFEFDDPRRNPNYFTDSQGNRYTRDDLKRLYGIKDSQGLRRLQAAERAAAAPPPTVEPPPVVEAPAPPPVTQTQQVAANAAPPLKQPIAILPKDLTPAQRRVARMQKGKLEAAERRTKIAEINGTPEEVVPKKSRAKALDVEAYTDGNDLRVVPEKGAKGGIVFETMRNVDPKAGKLKFEVPPGTSHAEANKLFKEKKKELLATLQQQATVATPGSVPFQDVQSTNMHDVDLHKMGLDVSNHDFNLSQGPAVKRLRKLTGSEHGGTYLDVLVKAIGPVGGGLTGFAMDDENRARGFVLGALAGGALQHYGGKGLKAILSMDYGNIGKEFADVAAQAKFRGQGDAYSRATRWLEHNFGSNPIVNRALSKAQGKASYAAEAWNKSLKYLIQQWDKMPPNIQDLLDDYATIEPTFAPAAFARLQSAVSDPKVLAAALLERHTRIGAQALVAEGLDPKNPLHQKIIDSFGVYQKTAYEIHTNPKYAPKQADIDATIQELRTIDPSLTEDMSREAVYHYLHDVYVENGMKGVSRYGVSKGSESLSDVIRKKNPDLQKRPAFRAMMGEITDPLKVRAATALKLIPAIRSGQFFSEMSTATTARGNKFALSPEEWDANLTNLRTQIAAGPPNVATLQSQLAELENYILSADDAQLGKLAGKYLHRQVVDRLPGVDGVFQGNSGPLIDSLIALNNHVKQAKVGANPMSWVRSAFGVPFFMTVAQAGGPKEWVLAARSLKNQDRLWKEMMEQGILSGGYGTGEARKDLGMVLDPNITEDGISYLWSKLVHVGAGAMDLADNYTRAAAYVAHKKRLTARGGLTPEEVITQATDWVNRYTMNYSTVAKGVRAFRQVPFSNQFITYTSEIARITKNLVADVATNKNGNRWKALTILGGIPGVFIAAQKIGEGQLSKEEKKEWDKIKPLLPEYKRHSFLVPTRRKKDGSFEYYNISPLFIADDIAKMVRSLADGDMDAFWANNPIVGWDNSPAVTVGAAAYGIDMRSGRPLDTLGQKIDAIRKEVLPPLFGGYEMDKFVKALTPNAEGSLGITNERTGQRFNISDLLASYVTGLRREDVRYNILVEKAYHVSQARIRAIESELRAKLMTNATPQDKQHALDIAQKKIMAIEEDFRAQLQYGE